ncbi:hypothetical protein PilKf_00752 [Pillotina sp. SPG140]
MRCLIPTDKVLGFQLHLGQAQWIVPSYTAERWFSLLQLTGKPVRLLRPAYLSRIFFAAFTSAVSTMRTDIPSLIKGAFVNGSTPITLLRGVTRIYLHHMNGMQCCTSIAVQIVHMTSLKAMS